MKKALYFLFLFPITLFAQINESDSLKLKADLALTGFWQEGNVETLIFRGKTGLSFRFIKNWVFKTQNSYIYQAFGKKKADEDILSLNFLYIHPERKIYPFVLGFVSTNFRREINLRYLLGGGATFQVIHKQNHWLKFSISSEYEETDFAKTIFNQTEYNGQRYIDTWRATLWAYGKYQFLNKKIIFYHESYFQPSIERINNFRWQADIGLELPLWKFLNFKANYLHTFESIVIENQKKEDKILSFGFTLKSY
ncbi:MAG: hypothetical protein OHK0053_01270 [Microscillaceae bacterium]